MHCNELIKKCFPFIYGNPLPKTAYFSKILNNSGYKSIPVSESTILIEGDKQSFFLKAYCDENCSLFHYSQGVYIDPKFRNFEIIDFTDEHSDDEFECSFDIRYGDISFNLQMHFHFDRESDEKIIADKCQAFFVKLDQVNAISQRYGFKIFGPENSIIDP